MMIEIAPEFRARVRRNEPLSRHTSWHVGGPADLFFTPHDRADLISFLRSLPEDVPIHFVGLGSNLLVRDGGLHGAVISTRGTLDRFDRLSQTTLYAEAGLPCARVAKQCGKWGLATAAFLAGIPGTLGGALAMNAGAFGGETWPHVLEVETVDRTGKVHKRAASEYQVGYREVIAPAADEWFVAARLRFERGDGESEPGTSESEVEALLERRRTSQPIGEWSCGSVFRNPPDNHAARLIEAAGLKGFQIGDAEVSTKHANFFINRGQARAADIEKLITHVQETVERLHGIRLVPEVRILGEAA
jgi:UDP-N-acetylmuramate dehydrogenase